MYKKIALVLILSSFVFAKEMRKKIVILDTGITKDFPSEYLCSEGHKDFSGQGINDTIHHGTHMAYIISRYLDTKKECILVVKYYDESFWSHANGLPAALDYIISIHASFVNMSFGGSSSSAREKQQILDLLKQGVIISAAAGNNGKDLTEYCNYYPACYAKEFNHVNFHIVGSCKDGKYEYYSNYGNPVTDCRNGTKVIAGPFVFSGTSQATAIRTGELVREKYKSHH